jgi:hypothetical protein
MKHVQLDLRRLLGFKLIAAAGKAANAAKIGIKVGLKRSTDRPA